MNNYRIPIKLMMLAVMALVFSSCSQETIEPDPNMAFTSNGTCKTWTDETVNDANIDFDYVATIFGNVVGINEEVDGNGKKFFKLGFIVTENSQNPGLVYALVDPVAGTWRRLDECRASNIAGFWDALSKNDSEDAFVLQQGTNKNAVYLFYGNNGKKFQRFRVDQGEVLKEFGNGGTLPGGFNGTGLFYHNYKRADFPANWLGIKGKKLYSFGPNLNGTPALIPVRDNGFNGADLNNNIRKVVGYWPFNTQRIVIEKINGTTITVQKERKNGVNFYKD